MATQEIDISSGADQSGITVAAADNTIANDLSLHWVDTIDKMTLKDLLTKAVNAFDEHLSSTSIGD